MAVSNVDLHRGIHRTMSDEGAEQAAAYFAPDIGYTDAARSLTLTGKAEATGWLTGWKLAFPDARVVAATYLDAGEWTIARFQGQGLNDGPLGDLPATGKQLDLAFCELLRWRDDLVVEGAMYYDTASMMTQLGHLNPAA